MPRCGILGFRSRPTTTCSTHSKSGSFYLLGGTRTIMFSNSFLSAQERASHYSSFHYEGMFSSQDSVMPALWGHEAADQHYCLPSEEFSGPAEQDLGSYDVAFRQAQLEQPSFALNQSSMAVPVARRDPFSPASELSGFRGSPATSGHSHYGTLAPAAGTEYIPSVFAFSQGSHRPLPTYIAPWGVSQEHPLAPQHMSSDSGRLSQPPDTDSSPSYNPLFISTSPDPLNYAQSKRPIYTACHFCKRRKIKCEPSEPVIPGFESTVRCKQCVKRQLSECISDESRRGKWIRRKK